MLDKGEKAETYMMLAVFCVVLTVVMWLCCMAGGVQL